MSYVRRIEGKTYLEVEKLRTIPVTGNPDDDINRNPLKTDNEII